MPTLYLLRHAKSSWDDPALDDAERPLASRGKRATAALRDHFASIGLTADVVLCSPARRTRETWSRVADGVAGRPDVRYVDDIYEAAPTNLVGLLRELPNTVEHALLIGHNPGVGELAVRLAGSGRSTLLADLRAGYPTGGFAALTVMDTWPALWWGRATLTAFVRPRSLA